MFNEKHTTNILPPFLYLYEDAIHGIKSLNQRHSSIHPSHVQVSVHTAYVQSGLKLVFGDATKLVTVSLNVRNRIWGTIIRLHPNGFKQNNVKNCTQL
jgi:hypothetical protein